MKKSRRFITFVLLAAIAAGLAAFNYYLWRLQESKRQHIFGLETQVLWHEKENQQLQARNQRKAQEVETLRSPESFFIYEEKARKEYGMIGENETFFMLRDADISHIADIQGLPDMTDNPLGAEMVRDSSAVPTAGIDSIRLESVGEDVIIAPDVQPTSAAEPLENLPEPVLQLESLQRP